MTRILTILVLFLALSACEKQTDWSLQESKLHAVVVDGIITDEVRTQSLRLTYSTDTLNEVPLPVVGAQVIVSSNGNIYQFHESIADPGNYKSDSQFAGLPGQEYSLLVTDSNQVYSAKARMGSGIGNSFTFTYVRNTSTNLFQFNSGPDAYTTLTPAMYELILDWSNVPGYQDADPDSTHARLYYYALTTLDVSELFAPAKEKISFPAGTLIIERRYFLTNEYAAYIRALLLETTWQGGYFSSATANMPTNLSNGAMGYFAASQVTTQIEIAH
jgi:hypothetical protein